VKQGHILWKLGICKAAMLMNKTIKNKAKLRAKEKGKAKI